MLVTVRKNKLMSNRKHNQIVEQLFFSFGCKHKWREIQIEPVTKYYSYKLLEEVDPIVSDSRYIVKRGTMKYDLMTYQNWSQFLVSKKLKSVLEKYDFNGYKCFPADIEGISETYYGWLNINEVGPIIKEDSDKNLVWFDLNTWNNFDIFHLKDTYMNVCTKEVKEAIEKENISNITFDPCYGISEKC